MICAYSKTMDAAQRNYGITDKELPAIAKSMEHFRRYLLGKRFVLKTDHKALTYLAEAANPTSRMLRWALKLQEYDYEIVYISGEKNGADGLSRYCVEDLGTVVQAVGREYSKEQKNEIMQEYHEKGGHAGATAMKGMMKHKYEWTNINKDIEEYTKRCGICAQDGDERQNTRNKVMRADKFNQLWECDLVGRISDTNNKNLFIFTAIDKATRWMEAKVISNKTGSQIVKCIEELIIKRHGAPQGILTDNGREFKNQQCKELAEKHGIEWKFASPFHHRTIGAIERANQS